MHDRLKKAFDQVQASDALKENTLAFLSEQYRTNRRSYPRVMAAAACLLFFLVVGNWFYFTPTAQISIDINPSLELGINRFGQVVSVEGKNDDGQALAESLQIKHLNYTDAIHRILACDSIAALLANDAVMSIGVIGPDGAQSDRILSDIETCTAQVKNTHCYHAHAEEVEAAHAAGLSYGKYRAYLQLQSLDPNITPDEIQNMTMGQLWDLIEQLSGSQHHNGNSHNGGNSHNENGHSSENGQNGNDHSSENGQSGNDHSTENGQNGNGHHHGQGKGHHGK